MPKRVSIKGKGADIFFGGEPTAPSGEPDNLRDTDPLQNSIIDKKFRPLPGNNNSLDNGEAKQEQRPVDTEAQLQPSGNTEPQSTTSPINPSVNQPINRPIDRIIDRPKGFYITEQLDRRLDDAVRYIREHHGIRKVDRSALLNAMLADEDTWTHQSLDLLVGRIVHQLTNRLTDQSISRPGT